MSFGFPGNMNDLNVLSVSPRFADILADRYPTYSVQYSIGGEDLDLPYYLADGIYPPWIVFIHSISITKSRKEQKYKRLHGSVRKGIERVFGVLFKRFGVLARLSRLWYSNSMYLIFKTCVIIHKMLVNERKSDYVFDAIGRLRSSLLTRLDIDTEIPAQLTPLEPFDSILPMGSTGDISLSF